MVDGRYSNRELMLLLAATTTGVFLSPFTSTMLNLALVSIGHEFSVSSHSLGMVNTLFLLTSVMTMVPVAKVADIYGLKKVFRVGVFVMLFSSLVAIFAPSFSILLLTRALMGIGAACLAVTAMTMIVNAFPANRRGWVIGVNTTSIYLGMALGPTIGGFVTDLLGWRFLFYILIPVSVISLIMIAHFKDDFMSDEGGRVDYMGTVLYASMILTMMYGMINLPETWAFMLMSIGVILFVVFTKYVSRSKHPILDMKIYKHKVFKRSILAAFMNYASSYSVSFFLALYLQNLGALSASQAGLVMLLQPLMQVLLTVKSGSMSDKLDKRLLPTIGMGITSVGILMILFMDADVSLAYVAVTLLVLGIGYGIFSAPNTSAVMSSVPPENRSLASGSLSLMRQTGMMTSMGIAMCCISLILGSTDNINPSTYGAFVDVMRTAFSICFVMCVIGTAVSWFRGSEESDTYSMEDMQY